MANSKQQAKRVRTAARQRLENLRYRSQVKTLYKRLQRETEAGETDLAAATHRRLQALLDRAASRNAIHRNAAARKKSQAARVVSRQTTSA